MTNKNQYDEKISKGNGEHEGNISFHRYKADLCASTLGTFNLAFGPFQ